VSVSAPETVISLFTMRNFCLSSDVNFRIREFSNTAMEDQGRLCLEVESPEDKFIAILWV
jgi:hypothetical protein